jgi:glyoxylase I family protein
MTAIAGWAHVTLSVRDHDRSVQWYSDVLGFQSVLSDSNDRWKRTICMHPESGTILVLHQHVSNTGEGSTNAARVWITYPCAWQSTMS